MNRSIQAEGTFGVIKWDKSYRFLVLCTYFGVKNQEIGN